MLTDLAGAVRAAFEKQYGYAPTHLGYAPGRVNLIGEHVDYSDGYVLPAAIDKLIYVAARLREDRVINVLSLDYNGFSTFTLDTLQDPTLPHWTRYPRGVPFILGKRGYTLRGMDMAIIGNVPRGGGFSSSAAVEVAMVEVITAMLAIPLSQPHKALLGVDVENQFVGIPSGIMDQMISAVGQAGHAILIDCRLPESGLPTLTPVPIPAGVSILTLDTATRRELVDSEYAARRRHSEEAATLFGVKALRDVTPDMFLRDIGKLPALTQTTPHRLRAAHAIHENARTLAAVAALERGDMPTAGRLLNESHVSLSDLYEVSIKELDIMAYLAQREGGCYGARMMGGGFGGAVIALVEDDLAALFGERVAAAYEAITGRTPTVYKAKPGAGSGVALV